MKRDVSFVVAEKVTHAALLAAFRGVDAMVVGAERFDEYRGKEIGAGKKSLAYHLEFRDEAATMTTEAADALLEKIRGVLRAKFQADVRS
jgi:phenylalanyl-tRNA synthetase beta chain